MKYFLYLLLLAGLILCSAAIYVTTDKNGHVSYSDVPTPDAKRLDVPVASVVSVKQPETDTSASVINKKTSANKPEVKAAVEAGEMVEVRKPYTSFMISSPVDQQTFQNQRSIPVSVNLVPELQKGDKIQLYINGKAIGLPVESTQLQFDVLERNTYQIHLDLLNAKLEKIKQSNSVTIYVKFATIGN